MDPQVSAGHRTPEPHRSRLVSCLRSSHTRSVAFSAYLSLRCTLGVRSDLVSFHLYPVESPSSPPQSISFPVLSQSARARSEPGLVVLCTFHAPTGCSAQSSPFRLITERTPRLPVLFPTAFPFAPSGHLLHTWTTSHTVHRSHPSRSDSPFRFCPQDPCTHIILEPTARGSRCR